MCAGQTGPNDVENQSMNNKKGNKNKSWSNKK